MYPLYSGCLLVIRFIVVRSCISRRSWLDTSLEHPTRVPVLNAGKCTCQQGQLYAQWLSEWAHTAYTHGRSCRSSLRAFPSSRSLVTPRQQQRSACNYRTALPRRIWLLNTKWFSLLVVQHKWSTTAPQRFTSAAERAGRRRHLSNAYLTVWLMVQSVCDSVYPSARLCWKCRKRKILTLPGVSAVNKTRRKTNRASVFVVATQ